MYHPSIIAAREESLLQMPGMRELYPQGIPRYSLDDARALTAQIKATRDEDTGQTIRGLTKEESDFAAASRVRVTIDAPFYLETFVWIDEEGHGLRSLYPLWESQQFALDRLGALELQAAKSGSLDGLLLNVLKARQLGISTIAEALVSHRIFSQPFIRAIAGSDTEEQAKYLFRMVERIYANLPHFLKPERAVPYSAGRELHLDNKSSLKTAWGKTTRGALQAEGGKKGNIERGRTNSVVHISELATWDNPEQLDGALLPGIPINNKSLVLFESTAELAGDWWHRHWIASQEGEGRFRNLFIPWCVEPSKYSSPAPDSWQPQSDTLAVAAQIERDSEPWVGRRLRLTRDQLHWYETTRAYYTKKNQLDQFYREYPSNPEECFQYAGKSVFTPSDLQRIDQAARPILDVWAVEPSRDIAELRRLTPEKAEQIEKAVKVLALQQDQRPAAPLSLRMASSKATLYPVPPGYGFRRLGKEELRDLPSLRHSVLTIFEYPRARGSRRYVMSVDVGDGLGLDYSVVTIVRLPTIEEPAEDVAQYVSNTVKPSQLAFVCDAIGRFYVDEDGTEALAAVELNNHGATVQDLLQLHLGYGSFYVWEVVDAATPEARYTKRIGWQTTVRTRPLLLEKFHDAVTSLDPLSGIADFRLNSVITRQEMHFFVTEGLLGEAEHAKGQHDDAIFSSAIGYYVAHRLAGGEAEPIAERRRRRQQLQAQTRLTGVTLDYRNTAVSADAAKEGIDDDADEDFGDDSGSIRYFDDRSRD